jgi:hypothetical protein
MPINTMPQFKDKDDDKDDDLDMIDELAKLEDAEDVINLPKTPRPGGGDDDIPTTPAPGK